MLGRVEAISVPCRHYLWFLHICRKFCSNASIAVNLFFMLYIAGTIHSVRYGFIFVKNLNFWKVLALKDYCRFRLMVVVGREKMTTFAVVLN